MPFVEKLHLGVDRCGVTVVQALTKATADDATVGIDLIGRRLAPWPV